MPSITHAQRQHIMELLQQGKDLPLDFKHLLFPPERQEYELVYAGKEREEDILAETMAVPLQPIRSFGGNGADWHNMLIFGDNLQAMKTLLKMKEQGELVNADGSRGIKLVYIDPPFATKQEFRGSQDERAYQDKVIGARFLEFLRKRLVLLRELLTSDGSIYLHLDTKKVHYVKVLLDEIFGENNFRNEIIWKRQSAHSDTKQGSAHYGRLHDTILFCSRGANFIWNPQYEPYDDSYIETFYRHTDQDGRDYRLSDLTAAKPGGDTLYEWRVKRAGPKEPWVADLNDEYKAPKEGWEYKGAIPYRGRFWAYSRANMEEFSREERLTYTRSGMPQYKRYKDEMPGRLLQDVWTTVSMGSGATERTGYPTQKGESLLAPVILTSSNPGDVVLDAFAGSGTTLAVAEKLGRRWIGIDCGKLAIYTMQKRMLNLRSEIGGKGKPLKPQPFTLYNAGLYDFSRLKKLPWEDWRFFALKLFESQDKPHKVSGISLDGYRGNDDVLVFNHALGGGVVLDYGFIDDLHAQIGSRIGARFFIIVPAASVTFLEDYIVKGRTRYYILRIPYSIINELHNRDFAAVTQPVDETQVNETVEAVGFDFIHQPKVECEYYLGRKKGKKAHEAIVKIKTFKSLSMAKGASQKGNLETLSMVLVDYDYPHDPERKGKEPPPPFELDATFLAGDIQAADWQVQLPLDELGKHVMLIYVDIYGNEYTEIKTPSEWQRNLRG